MRFSLKRIRDLFQRDIWHPAYLTDRSWKGRGFAVLRVITITITGLEETRAVSRAAALSFSTLLGLGPLIGLAALVAGFALGENDASLIAEKIGDLLRFAAPSVHQYEQAAVNPELVALIENFIAGTKSSAGGILSVILIIAIVLQLFTSIEGVFNDIWGVRSGRSWMMRIVFYWTTLTLGAVFFFGAVGALSAATFLSYFRENLPFGPELATALAFALPALSVVLLVLILAVFYKYIPNTHVFWRAAVIGAFVVALLLVANNLLAFFYLQRVDFTRSLYGSLGMLPILMFGLYVFWLFILVGGQISYAVQNVHFRSSQAAWSNLTPLTRERLTLAVLLAISRRFQACQPPTSVTDLATIIKVPTQILNECINRLVDLGFVSMVPPDPKSDNTDFLYQPARPLTRTTLVSFKQSFENLGENPVGDTLSRIDPILGQYDQTLRQSDRDAFLNKTLDQLCTEFPFTEPTTKSPAIA